MALKNKYQREKQQYSNDSGRTWIDVSPANYRRGRLIEAGSDDCNTIEWKEVTGSWFCIGFNETQYRWVTVSGEFLCDTGNKYAKEKEQVSEDGGMTWTDTGQTRAGTLIEVNSEDCGYTPPTPTIQTYLTIQSLEDNNTIGFKCNLNNVKRTISISTDNGVTWTGKTSSTSGKILATLNTGEKMLIKGDNSSYAMSGTSEGSYNYFTSTKQFVLEGNIMSLINSTNFENLNTLTSERTFNRLFYNCSKLVSAENLSLPAMTLTRDCYGSMFVSCTSLTTAPALPATALADNCYWGMFHYCTSLTTAPELPATTLANSCYRYMFWQCKSLTTAPELPATTLAEGCYQEMFAVCTSLTTAPALPATTLVDYCYNGMFDGCTSLTTAPTLPAETLAGNCYNYMFYGCGSLNYIKAMFTTTPGTDYTSSWVSGVASTGTFVKNKDATWDVTGTSGIPTGWTVVTE